MKIRKWFNLILISCTLAIGHTACDNDEYNESTVTTPDVDLALNAPVISEINVPTAKAVTDVQVNQKDIDSGKIRVMAYGFCYSNTPTPTIYDATVKATMSDKTMIATLTELENNTNYYVRAFATIYPQGVIYSPEVKMEAGTVTDSSEEKAAE